MKSSNLTQSIVQELLDYNIPTALTAVCGKPFTATPFPRKYPRLGVMAGKRALTIEVPSPTTLYFYGVINYEMHSAHRVAFLWMTGDWPIEVDHKDGEGTNNRWKNLREVTRTVNQQNRRLNKSYKGLVTKFKFMGIKKNGAGYGARITVNKKPIWLGTFKTVAKAASVRRKAQEQYGFSDRHGT